jgi:predicted ABC-type ATPase
MVGVSYEYGCELDRSRKRRWPKMRGRSLNVPEVDVRRRYLRSFQNLAAAISRADHTILFDNSTEEGYRLVAVLGPSGSQWFEPVPDWAQASRS